MSGWSSTLKVDIIAALGILFYGVCGTPHLARAEGRTREPGYARVDECPIVIGVEMAPHAVVGAGPDTRNIPRACSAAAPLRHAPCREPTAALPSRRPAAPALQEWRHAGSCRPRRLLPPVTGAEENVRNAQEPYIGWRITNAEAGSLPGPAPGDFRNPKSERPRTNSIKLFSSRRTGCLQERRP